MLFDLRSNSTTKLLSCSLFSEYKPSSRRISLNSIMIDPRNPNYLAVGGSDEYARVYDFRKCQLGSSSNLDSPVVDTFCPHHLLQCDNVHITGLAYSNRSELLVSYNDELIYLFQKNMGFGPNPLAIPYDETLNLDDPQVYSGHRNSLTVKGVNFFGPDDDYVMSGSDCGRIFIWKKKEAELVCLMVRDTLIVNQIEPHPCMPVLATCGMEKNAKLWTPMSKNVQPLPADIQEIMESNRRGREDHSRVALTPDVITHVLQPQRRQAFAYVERQYSGGDGESDEEDGLAYIFGFSDEDAANEGNPRDCNIS